MESPIRWVGPGDDQGKKGICSIVGFFGLGI